MGKGVLTFYLDQKLFGIEIDRVKEISRKVEYGMVPDSPKYLLGLLNLRGQVITLLDLSMVIKEKKEKREKRATKINAIILKKDPLTEEQVGLMIDEAVGVVEVEKEDEEAPPANLGELKTRFIKGIVKLEKELIIVVDIDKVVEVQEDER